jgi:WD40 repeat protein
MYVYCITCVIATSTFATQYDTIQCNVLHTGHSGQIRSVAYSSEGTIVYSCGDDGQIKLCEATQATLLASLSDHSSYVLSLAVSPDATKLASGYFPLPLADPLCLC